MATSVCFIHIFQSIPIYYARLPKTTAIMPNFFYPWLHYKLQECIFIASWLWTKILHSKRQCRQKIKSILSRRSRQAEVGGIKIKNVYKKDVEGYFFFFFCNCVILKIWFLCCSHWNWNVFNSIFLLILIQFQGCLNFSTFQSAVVNFWWRFCFCITDKATRGRVTTENKRIHNLILTKYVKSLLMVICWISYGAKSVKKVDSIHRNSISL